jgi:hypothetical protein
MPNTNRGNTSYGYRTKRPRIDQRPPWTTGTHHDTRKDTKLMKQVQISIDIRDSVIHGKGAFAMKDIPIGKIAWYRGPIYSSCHIESTFRPTTFMMQLSEGKTIDAIHGKHWTKYINDARGTDKDYNVEFRANGSVHSIRVILEGEELLADYGDNYWGR